MEKLQRQISEKKRSPGRIMAFSGEDREKGYGWCGETRKDQKVGKRVTNSRLAVLPTVRLQSLPRPTE